MGSEYCSGGASRVRRLRRLLKMLPGPRSTLVLAPLNQPRAGSYCELDTRTRVDASRGTSAPANAIPFNVVLFWLLGSPSTDGPCAVGRTPGIVAAIAARSPARLGGTVPF